MIIRDTQPHDAAQVAELVDQVAQERRFLAITTGFSEDDTRAFISHLQLKGGVHIIAEQEGRIVGWCDIAPLSQEGMTHIGRLGLGVRLDCRGVGVGEQLLAEAIERAFSIGLIRIELEVFATNRTAIRLYERSGFISEGRKVAAWILDDLADDILLYALLKAEQGAAANP